MRTPDQSDFPQEIKDKIFSIESIIANYRLLQVPGSNQNEDKLDSQLFRACVMLRAKIGAEEIDDIVDRLIEMAEANGIDLEKIMVIFMSAQIYHLNELKQVQESSPQPPNTRLMEEILESIKNHSHQDDILSDITLKLTEILKAPANIDMEILSTPLMVAVYDTPLAYQIMRCIIRAQNKAIREYEEITASAESEVGKYCTFFSNRVIKE